MDQFILMFPSLEIVVIGTGVLMVPVETAVRRYLQSKGINVEIQDTVSFIQSSRA